MALQHADDVQNDQQHSPEFLRINPRGEVPVLVDGDKTFSDSSSILVWLAGRYGQGGKTPGPSSFWSNDLYEQTQIVDWVSCQTQ
jgi:glutathione S-transferase